MTQRITIPSLYLTSLKVSTPKDAMRQIAIGLGQQAGLHDGAIFQSLSAAHTDEKAIIADGLALIAGTCPTIHEPLSAFARLTVPVSFKGAETRPCDLVYALLMPPAPHGSHLQMLSSTSRALKDDGFLDMLRKVETRAQLHGLFLAYNNARLKAA